MQIWITMHGVKCVWQLTAWNMRVLCLRSICSLWLSDLHTGHIIVLNRANSGPFETLGHRRALIKEWMNVLKQRVAFEHLFHPVDRTFNLCFFFIFLFKLHSEMLGTVYEGWRQNRITKTSGWGCWQQHSSVITVFRIIVYNSRLEPKYNNGIVNLA